MAYLLALGRISVETGRTAIDARSYIHARASWQRLYRGPRVIWNGNQVSAMFHSPPRRTLTMVIHIYEGCTLEI